MKSFYLITFFFIIINSSFSSINNGFPQLERGMINLSGYDFEKDGLLSLGGEWEFYWGQLFSSEDFANKKFEGLVGYVPRLDKHFKILSNLGQNLNFGNTLWKF